MKRDEVAAPEPYPDHTEADIRPALDRHLSEAVPPALTALFGIYAVLAAAHLAGLPSPHPFLVSGVSGATAALFALGRIVVRRTPIPPGFGHPVATAIALVVLANTLFQLQLTGEAMHTTRLLLVVLGVGLFFLDWSWFAIPTTLLFAGWFLVARPHLPDPEWVHFGVSLFLATVLAALVVVVRRRSLLRVEELRRQERVRQLEVESALDQTERARRGEAEARRELENTVARLKESEARFRHLADATFEGVLIFRDGSILDANSKAAQLFEIPGPRLVGRGVMELIDPASRSAAEHFLSQLRATVGAPARTFEARGVRSGGDTFAMAVSILHTVHREEPAEVMVIRDITDQKRIEQVLRHAVEEAEASSQAKNTFLANMSHELRTPLNSVIGFANILLKKSAPDLPPKEADYLKRIRDNGEHLLSVIDDILDLSKIDAKRMEMLREPIQLEEMLADLLQTFDLQARRKGIDLETEVPSELRPLIADARRLRQILLNLVGNALKFTASGSITIRVISDEETDRPVRIEVEDTGIGIPEKELDRIFTPFLQVDDSSRRAAGGTGLGLSISRSLCHLMGFELHARSREGEGSTFVIDLDQATPASDDHRPLDRERAGPFS